MKTLKEFIYKISFKRNWSVQYQGVEIHAQNWWTLPWISGEIYSLNGKVLQSNFHWLPAFPSIFMTKLEGIGECKIMIAYTWWGGFGCHFFINDNLIGGDIDKKLYHLPKDVVPPKKYPLNISPYPSLRLKLMAFLLDMILILFLNYMLYVIVFGFFLSQNNPEKVLFYTFLTQSIFGLIYFGPIQAYDEGSVGKKMFGLKLVDKSLNRLSMMNGFKRYIFHFSFLLIGGFGFIKILFDRDRQGWHDQWSNSMVVKADYLAWERFQRSRLKKDL